MLGGNAARNLAQKGIAAVTCPVTNNVGALTRPVISARPYLVQQLHEFVVRQIP